MSFMSQSQAWRAVIVLASVSMWRAESFCNPKSYPSHLSHAEVRHNAMRMSEHFASCCDFCNTTDQISCCDKPLLVELPFIPIHTSRRKFIQFVATFTGISSFDVSPSAAASGVGTYGDSNSVLAPDRKNLIAIPGPLPPFSTTRTYRNIVLSNGLKVVLVKDKRAQRSSVALSIDGAGQFAEPDEIPGLAHLMEHIVLSSSRGKKSKAILQRKARKIWNPNPAMTIRNPPPLMASTSSIDKGDEEDFEDWLSDNDGDSNAFTAPGFVCFHFNGPHEILPEGLERFSRLFTLDEVETTTQKPFVIPREIERVTDELDRTSDASRAFYFLKSNINPEHPFARFSAGSKRTLKTIPEEKGIDVATELLRFFRDHYLASKATLVVVGKDELSSMDWWISPFSNVMSQKAALTRKQSDSPFPDPMIGKSLGSNGLTQSILLRSKDDMIVDENYQTLCIEWPLSIIYSPRPNFEAGLTPTENVITPPAVGFVLTQIISRRGPGSLRFLLERFGWVPKEGSKGVPRITFPVDVSGFQILRLELGITLEGFSNRSAVLSAVFESIRKSIERPLQLDLIKQYLAAGQLHGYFFSPRPPDSISLAVDSLRYGIGGTSGVANLNSNWYLMPSSEDNLGAEYMRQLVTNTLRTMSDEKNPLVSFRASAKAIYASSGGLIDQSITTPPVFSPWKVEPITGARYFVENRGIGASSYFKSLSWFAATFDLTEDLSPPSRNPLIPTKFRAPRPVIERQESWGGSRYFYLEDASAYEGTGQSTSGLKLSNLGTWRELQTVKPLGESKWKSWHVPPAKQGFIGLPLPVRPPEPSMECAFVVQLLSSLPLSFTSSQLALTNLWLLSFDDEILDLAELGATAGIAYETSLNTDGLRISFRGVSQTLPSYVRRFCRRLVQHHVKILDGSTKISESVYQRAISEVERSPKISKLQKEQLIAAVKQGSEKDIARQASFFLRCTNGGYLISQGDVLPNESMKLLSELQYVFREFGFADGFAVEPDLRSLLYRPIWKPRNASPCLLPGLSLISDSCGRIPR